MVTTKPIEFSPSPMPEHCRYGDLEAAEDFVAIGKVSRFRLVDCCNANLQCCKALAACWFQWQKLMNVTGFCASHAIVACVLKYSTKKRTSREGLDRNTSPMSAIGR
jgi:hypothetical protein